LNEAFDDSARYRGPVGSRPGRDILLHGLFEQILGPYDRKAEEVEVSFDPTYHFLVKASVDGRKDTSDDEWRVEVSGFAPEK
jgi:hypothetical protein